MNKFKKIKRIVAIFLLATFLNTLIPYNQLIANNNGPKAPEAGSFEPVDATDMVNLLTGDFTYVLPLLNVPSPEGGYPISLAYHAGIAMDQEASWVGLGWNLNPGVINRSVNGFPDDYNNVKVYENFYDEGGTEEFYTLSLGYADPTGVASVGLNFSWGTNRAFGGGVSFGVGLPLSGKLGAGSLGLNVGAGSNGSSLGVDYQPGSNGGLSFGASVSSDGSVGGNLGVVSNGSGFSISGSSSGSVGIGLGTGIGKNNSLGLNFSISESGIGISGTVKNKDSNNRVVGGAGAGANISFANTLEQGDYVTNSSGWTIPVIVPTPIGTFSAAFGKQKVEWFLNNIETNNILSPLYFDQQIETEIDPTTGTAGLISGSRFKLKCRTELESPTDCPSNPYRFLGIYFDYNVALEVKNSKEQACLEGNCAESCSCEITEVIDGLMDVYELPISNEMSITDLSENNAIFPNYDNFNVEAQGLSGNMTLKHFENANLFTLQKQLPTHSIEYSLDVTTYAASKFIFNGSPDFYFENEFSSYLGANPIETSTNVNEQSIFGYNELSYSDNGQDFQPLNRRKVSKYIEYFTNDEIFSNGTSKYTRGYIEPRSFSDLSNPSNDAIGAFTVTGSDGKQYHYSIPVYNYNTVSRTIGAVKDNNENAKLEADSYFERIQDEPYATHWLLTAVTGPDYIDLNNNHRVDEADYGYWVEFDYGRWSEAYTWKTPYGEEYLESKDDEDTKVIIHGIKDIYYLDHIKTRTHTALFIKSLRNDNLSNEWTYRSVDWGLDQDSNHFTERFHIPEQRSLKLDQVLLLKNEDASTINKFSGSIQGIITRSELVNFPSPDSPPRSHQYNRVNKILNTSDLSEEDFENAVKVIDLTYANDQSTLVRGTPNHITNGGRLTLDHVDFRGKGNTPVMPPYNFSYYNEHDFDTDAQNEWGYHEEMPWDWSIKEIQTPEGGTIEVVYESDDFDKPVIHTGKLFSRGLSFEFLSYPPATQQNSVSPLDATEGMIDVRISFDNEDPINDLNMDMRDYFTDQSPVYIDLWLTAINNFPGNGYDRSAIDIKGDYAQVLEVNPTNILVRVPASNPVFNRYNILQDINSVSFLEAQTDLTLVIGQGGIIPLHFGENQKNTRYDRAWRPDGNRLGYSLQFKVIGNKPAEEDRNGTVNDITNGDIRVKQLITSNGIDQFATGYQYQLPGYDGNPSSANYKSSGVVPYIPGEDTNPIPYSLELPAPKVMYEYVTVQDYDSYNLPQGKIVYHFNVMKEKAVDQIKFENFFEITVDEENEFENTNRNVDVNITKLTVHDNLASIGQLLSLETFNETGHLLSKTENEYFDTADHPNDQGIDQQSYQTYKEVVFDESLERNEKWLVNSSTRRNYVTALKTSKTIVGGESITTYYNTYDDVTGGTMETTSFTSAGLRVKNKVVPAFRKPEYNIAGYGMGSKVDDVTNKNMLTQEAANFSYLIDESGNESVLGANIMTWDNEWTYRGLNGDEYSPTDPKQKIWRKQADFIWKGDLNEDGTYADYNGIYDGFNWSLNANSQEEQWQKLSETTRYDHFSMPLESMDINGNYASTKTDSDSEKIKSVANAAYTEQFYSGAEEGTNGVVGGEINLWNPVTLYAHTGNYSEKAGTTSTNFRCSIEPVFNQAQLDAGENSEKYKVSVWTHRDNYQNARIYNGTELEPFKGERVFAGDWVMLNHYLDLSATTEIYVRSASGFVYFDDFRVHPIESSMTSYVYNEWDELTHIIGSNNLAVRYEYDAGGRLRRVYTEVANTGSFTGGFKLTVEYNQNYKRELQNPDEHVDDQTGSLPLSATSININPLSCGGSPGFPLGPNERGIIGNVSGISGGSGNYGYTWEFSTSPGSWSEHHSTQGTMLQAYNPANSTLCNQFMRVRCTIRDNSDATVSPLTLTSGERRVFCGECENGGGPEQ